jgi:hypothetical protein
MEVIGGDRLHAGDYKYRKNKWVDRAVKVELDALLPSRDHQRVEAEGRDQAAEQLHEGANKTRAVSVGALARGIAGHAVHDLVKQHRRGRQMRTGLDGRALVIPSPAAHLSAPTARVALTPSLRLTRPPAAVPLAYPSRPAPQR